MVQTRITETLCIGDGCPLTLIGGPCVIESEAFTLQMAEGIAAICQRLNMPFIFKSSFDKANRTAMTSFRGQELDIGMKILQRVKDEVGVPVLTDIHESYQAEIVAEVVDVLQIPAFLCRQTDLLLAAAATCQRFGVSYWDAAILEAARSLGCDLVLSEDLGDGRNYAGVRVENPFRTHRPAGCGVSGGSA